MRLDLESQGRVACRLQEGLECRHALPFADIHSLDLRQGRIADRHVLPADTQEVSVVDDHKPVVGGALDVELEAVGSISAGPRHRCDRVLGRVRLPGAVRDQLDLRWIDRYGSQDKYREEPESPDHSCDRDDGRWR